jgi:hypothetical protein
MTQHERKNFNDFLNEIKAVNIKQTNENTKNIDKCNNAIWGNGQKGLKFWVLILQVQTSALIIGIGFIVTLLIKILSKVKGL